MPRPSRGNGAIKIPDDKNKTSRLYVQIFQPIVYIMLVPEAIPIVVKHPGTDGASRLVL